MNTIKFLSTCIYHCFFLNSFLGQYLSQYKCLELTNSLISDLLRSLKFRLIEGQPAQSYQRGQSATLYTGIIFGNSKEGARKTKIKIRRHVYIETANICVNGEILNSVTISMQF